MTWCEYTVRRSAQWIRSYWLRLVTLPTVSVRYVRFLYTVWRHITLTHAMAWYVTMPHAVYGVCTSSHCVCTQFCGVRHPNCVNWRTAYEKDVDRSIFHCSLPQVPSAPLLFCCSIIVVKCSWGLGSCSWQSIDELLLWSLVSWRKRRKSNKKSRKQADIKTKFPISYFGHACPK